MSKLIDAIRCQNQGRPPIWLMRQAGRYMPHYRKLKEGRSLFEMFHDPETVAEVTLLPIKLLQVDGAILFSDILTIFDGLNIRYDFQEGVGPIVYDPPSKIQLLDPQEAFHPISQSIKILKQQLQVPLLGFAGAPFTIASYLIEGKTSRDLKETKKWLFQNHETFNQLIETITESTIQYLHLQIDSGIEAVQLFDSWANALGLDEFKKYCLKPLQKITQAIQARGIPVILFSRGSCLFAEELAQIKPDALSLDWSYDLALIRKKIPPSIALQGNLDPMVLFASPEYIKNRAETLLTNMEEEPGYIFNLGHGILPDTPFENVQQLVHYVLNRSPIFA